MDPIFADLFLRFLMCVLMGAGLTLGGFIVLALMFALDRLSNFNTFARPAGTKPPAR